MADVHVVANGDRWEVEHGGRTVSTHRTQDQAIGAGRDEAKVRSCELVVHGADGAIREKDSEGSDPQDVPG